MEETIIGDFGDGNIFFDYSTAERNGAGIVDLKEHIYVIKIIWCAHCNAKTTDIDGIVCLWNGTRRVMSVNVEC